MRSHLLEGTVRHRRARPTVYALEHDVYYLALDLDELDVVDDRLRLVGRNRRERPGVPRRRPLAGAGDRPPRDGPRPPARLGEDPTGWRITLVTNLRTFGYVFNPAASTCAATRPAACAWSSSRSTTRTWSATCTRCDRRRRRQPAGRPSRSWPRWTKDFYVSPFIDMDGRYTVHVADRPTELRIAIAVRQDDAPAPGDEPRPRAPAADATGPSPGCSCAIRWSRSRRSGCIHWHACACGVGASRSSATASRPASTRPVADGLPPDRRAEVAR